MIEVKDLRIGNWIKDGHEFEQIEIEHLVCLSSGRCEFDPIPLTEELLIKLGFEQMYFLGAKINYYFEGNLIYSIIDRHVEYKNGSINFIIRKCEHVHDLQNLYFALTGEELNLKTKEL